VQRRRSEAEAQIARLLRTARRKLDLSVAFLSRVDERARTMQVVDTLLAAPADGYSGPRDSGFCLAVLEGRLPRVMPDVRRVPEAMALHPADLPQIRGHVSVPVVLSDGTVYGTFCAYGLVGDPEVSPRDLALMEVLADAAALVIEPQLRTEQEHAEIHHRIDPVIGAGGPDVVLQPIVSLCTGARVGAEALSRFPAAWGRSPDVVFGEAHRIGAGHRLELLALACGAGTLGDVDGYVSLNVSAQTLLTPQCGEHRSAASCSRPCRSTGSCWSSPSTTRSTTTPPSRGPWPRSAAGGCGWPSTTSAPASPACGTSSWPART
jgi:hypothetical protein